MIRRPLVLKDGIISELPIGDSVPGSFPDGDKFAYHVAALAAYDRIAAINYADSGLRNQRISGITYTSSLFPDSNIVKNIYYLDVGNMNQRIDKIEYVGSIFSPDSLRKVFNYSLSGIKYKVVGYNYELF
jgi:hypothetical protein